MRSQAASSSPPTPSPARQRAVSRPLPAPVPTSRRAAGPGAVPSGTAAPRQPPSLLLSAVKVATAATGPRNIGGARRRGANRVPDADTGRHRPDRADHLHPGPARLPSSPGRMCDGGGGMEESVGIQTCAPFRVFRDAKVGWCPLCGTHGPVRIYGMGPARRRGLGPGWMCRQPGVHRLIRVVVETSPPDASLAPESPNKIVFPADWCSARCEWLASAGVAVSAPATWGP